MNLLKASTDGDDPIKFLKSVDEEKKKEKERQQRNVSLSLVLLFSTKKKATTTFNWILNYSEKESFVAYQNKSNFEYERSTLYDFILCTSLMK